MEPEPTANLQTRVFSERTVYDSEWVKLKLVDVELPSGHRFEHHVVELSPVAIAVLLDPNDQVLMLWRHRFATDQWGFEFVGGLVEAGEQPVDAAAREALEESGWRPIGNAEHVAGFQPLPGMVDSPVDIFVWSEAERVGLPSDPEEAALMRWVPLADLPKLFAERQLLGAGTIVAALFLIAKANGLQVK